MTPAVSHFYYALNQTPASTITTMKLPSMLSRFLLKFSGFGALMSFLVSVFRSAES